MKRIDSLRQLSDAAIEKKAVIVPKHCAFSAPRPAAFIINLQGALILRLFRAGVYEYEKKEKK